MTPRIAIATPIPFDPTQAFLDALPQEYDLLIVDDSEGNTQNGLTFPRRDNMFFYGHEEQKKILGKYFEEYKTFHKSSSCRNIAHFIAYKEGYDIVITLDYDCVVPATFIADHTDVYKQQSLVGYKTKSNWINPLENTKWFTRGFPYRFRGNYELGEEEIIQENKVVLNMGLWENVVDINGIDKVLERPPKSFPLQRDYTIPRGYIPLCGMNNSFLSKIIPGYFFLPNFTIGDWVVSRHDDIWGGYIFQKLAQIAGDMITYGKPVVFHERESNQAKVLSYEHYMHILEPYFYELVDSSTDGIKANDYQTMFAEFAENFEKTLEKKKQAIPEPYYQGFKHQSKYINLWKTFFQEL